MRRAASSLLIALACAACTACATDAGTGRDRTDTNGLEQTFACAYEFVVLQEDDSYVSFVGGGEILVVVDDETEGESVAVVMPIPDAPADSPSLLALFGPVDGDTFSAVDADGWSLSGTIDRAAGAVEATFYQESADGGWDQVVGSISGVDAGGALTPTFAGDFEGSGSDGLSVDGAWVFVAPSGGAVEGVWGGFFNGYIRGSADDFLADARGTPAVALKWGDSGGSLSGTAAGDIVESELGEWSVDGTWSGKDTEDISYAGTFETTEVFTDMCSFHEGTADCGDGSVFIEELAACMPTSADGGGTSCASGGWTSMTGTGEGADSDPFGPYQCDPPRFTPFCRPGETSPGNHCYCSS